jgi:undecaprenyl-phosphate 4-deoxy-4-formamido-L-arabinose transferase
MHQTPLATSPMSVSVVVPVYNSEGMLRDVAERLHGALREIAGMFELVFVNDGSADGSWRVIAELGERYPWVRGISLMRNYGQHNAVLCGIRAARYEVIVTIDDDLQHPPEEIPRLLEKLVEAADVVYGTPQKERHTLWRAVASWVTKLALQSVMGADTARKVSAFRAFRTHLRDAFAAYGGPFVSIDVLLTWGTTRFAATAVRHDPRKVGASQYTFRKLITHALNMMTGFSTLPLQFASLVGFAFTLFGAGVLVYVVGRYLIQGASVPGFPFLASVIAIFSGAQLFALGIIGEYLARMHFRMMDRPPYTVRSATAPRNA